MNPRTPKTLKIDDLRRLLGEDQVSRLVTAIKGEGPTRARPLQVTREQLDKTVALVNGEAAGDARRAWIGTVPVFRLYFAESPQRQRRFTEWADEWRGEAEERPAPRRRSRTGDPESPVTAGI